MHFLQAINSDISVLTVCNKTGGTIKRRYKKNPIIINEMWPINDPTLSCLLRVSVTFNRLVILPAVS